MEKKEENYSKSKETVSQNKNDGVSLHVLIMGCDKTADNTYKKAYINNKIMEYLYEELFDYILNPYKNPPKNATRGHLSPK